MLKRVKRKTSKHQSVEKAEDFSLNSSKKEVPSEIELLQQVTAELKAEVKTLKEQLEREKKTSNDVKSLKTQQVCTLTFKLANAVRQRELAEEELAKVQKEMEELKEVIKSQEEKLKGKESEDKKNVEFDGEVEQVAREKSAEQELKEVKDVEEEVFETQEEELKGKESEVLVNGELTSEIVHWTEDENVQQRVNKTVEFKEEELTSKQNEGLANGELTSEIVHWTEDENVQQQLNKNSELKEILNTEEGEDEPKGIEIEIEHNTLDKNVARHRFSEETSEVNDHEHTEADGYQIAFPCSKRDGSTSLNESPISANDSLYLEQTKNECNELFIENSPLENSPPVELRQNCIPYSEISPLSSLELSEFEPWKESSSILDKQEDIFHFENFQNSSSEMYVSSRATSSFETCEDYADNKEEMIHDFSIQSDLCLMNEPTSSVSNAEYGVTKDLKNSAVKKDVLERGDPYSARKNRRMGSQNSKDQESSPSTSPVSSGYVSNGADDKLASLPMHHVISGDHSVAVPPGNYRKAQEASPKKFAYEYENADVTSGNGKEQDKKTLEDFVTKYEATPIEKRCLSSEACDDGQEKDIRISQGKQNNFFSQNVSEEVEDLKQQLKSALKEIEELRLENKEMKKEMRKLSTSAEENAFLVKTTQFTDRLLREMREREAKVHRTHSHSHLENYGLERDFPEFSQMMQHRSVRRSEDFLSRPARRGTSLPLKVIGAKLKEITRSVENMAMDPELSAQTLSETSAPDFLDFEQSSSHPNRSDHFEMEEQLIVPAHSSERLAQTAVPFAHDTMREFSQGGHTSVEKLGEERFHDPSNTQPQLTEGDCGCKEKTFQLCNQAKERSVFENCRVNWNRDSRDYVQRYVVRSSDYIAKLRDLKPEELAFYSKFK